MIHTQDNDKNKDTDEHRMCYYMQMRKSKTTRHSAKSLRENHTNFNYADLFKSDSE